MSASSELVERSGHLKRALVEFAYQPRFSRAMGQALEQRFGPFGIPEEGEFTNFLDWFVLEQAPRRPKPTATRETKAAQALSG